MSVIESRRQDRRCEKLRIRLIDLIGHNRCFSRQAKGHKIARSRDSDRENSADQQNPVEMIAAERASTQANTVAILFLCLLGVERLGATYCACAKTPTPLNAAPFEYRRPIKYAFTLLPRAHRSHSNFSSASIHSTMLNHNF